MGRASRPKPTRLAVKLRQVRDALGLTQQQMYERLGETKTALYPGHVGLYETGQREPPLPVLLRYARIAGIYVEVLIDDELDMPESLPNNREYEWALRRVRPHERAARKPRK